MNLNDKINLLSKQAQLSDTDRKRHFNALERAWKMITQIAHLGMNKPAAKSVAEIKKLLAFIEETDRLLDEPEEYRNTEQGLIMPEGTK